VLAVGRNHVQSPVAVNRVLAPAAVHDLLRDFDLAEFGREAPLGHHYFVVALVAEDAVDAPLAETAVDLVAAAPARGDVAALVGIGVGLYAAPLFTTPYQTVVAKITQDPIGPQAALHLIRAAVSPHEISAGAAAHLVVAG
jgi:hypothetical protein